MLDTTVRPVHGGNFRDLSRRSGLRPEEILDFSANLNPFGPPGWLAEEVSGSLSEATRYPDPDAGRLREAASLRWSAVPEGIVCANGSDELFRAIVRGVGAKSVIAPSPSYASYADTGKDTILLPLRSDSGFRPDFGLLAEALRTAGPGAAVFLGAPNNPTGVLPDFGEIGRLAAHFPESWFIVDEAFLDFVSKGDSFASRKVENAISVRSLTKFWSIPGIRVGLCISAPHVARRIRRELPQWPVNIFAERVGARALLDDGFDAAARTAIPRLREKLAADLGAIAGIVVQEGAAANFLLLKVLGSDSSTIEERTLRRGVAVRDCANFAGFPVPGKGEDPFGWIRVAVRTESENATLVSALRDALEEGCSL